MTKHTHLPMAITQEFDCSYLPNRTEQLIFVQPEQPLSAEFYQQLMARGFRRSGNDVYRPHCPQCNDCQSLRIAVDDFIPSKSQKRIINKNKSLEVKISTEVKPSYYPLYEQYIRSRHQSGSMFPPNEEQLSSFTQCQWMDMEFIELYQAGTLVSVAVIDRSPQSISAVYTFFDPKLDKLSLGSYNILLQLSLARENNIDYVYLGYFINDCDSMKYKQKFMPHQRFINDSWIIFKK